MNRSVARHPRPWRAILDGEAADTAGSSGDELMLGYQTMWRAACDAQPTDTFAEASGQPLIRITKNRRMLSHERAPRKSVPFRATFRVTLSRTSLKIAPLASL